MTEVERKIKGSSQQPQKYSGKNYKPIAEEEYEDSDMDP